MIRHQQNLNTADLNTSHSHLSVEIFIVQIVSYSLTVPQGSKTKVATASISSYGWKLCLHFCAGHPSSS